MAFLDFVIGKRSLNKQRKLADEFVDRFYNPDKLDPMLDEYNRVAAEGINDDEIRSGAVKDIFASAQIPKSVAGSGVDLASLQQSDFNKASAITDMNTQLGLADENAKDEGRKGVAQVLTQMREMDAQRDAGKIQNRLDIEAEASSRKQKFLGGFLKLGVAAVATAATGNPAPLIDEVVDEQAPDTMNGSESWYK